MYAYVCLTPITVETVMVVFVWGLDLQLPEQSVPITTKVVNLNLSRRGVLDATLCYKVCQ